MNQKHNSLLIVALLGFILANGLMIFHTCKTTMIVAIIAIIFYLSALIIPNDKNRKTT
jgi:hypothetical protein